MLDTVNTVKTDRHYWSGQIYYVHVDKRSRYDDNAAG